MKVIAHIETEFPTKFGLPRQSGLVEELRATIVFEPEYRVDEALRGIEEWSHLWLLWEFHQMADLPWSPTVRPPRLGGNRRMGVFATRSPFRPNALGLSCVRLVRLESDRERGTFLVVAGVILLLSHCWRRRFPLRNRKNPYQDSDNAFINDFSEYVKRNMKGEANG